MPCEKFEWRSPGAVQALDLVNAGSALYKDVQLALKEINPDISGSLKDIRTALLEVADSCQVSEKVYATQRRSVCTCHAVSSLEFDRCLGSHGESKS